MFPWELHKHLGETLGYMLHSRGTQPSADLAKEEAFHCLGRYVTGSDDFKLKIQDSQQNIIMSLAIRCTDD